MDFIVQCSNGILGNGYKNLTEDALISFRGALAFLVPNVLLQPCKICCSENLENCAH